VISLLVAAWYYYLYISFERETDAVAKTLGFRKSTKRKKNVKLYGQKHPGGHHWHVIGIIKDWRKGTYEYVVNNKTYKRHHIAYDDPGGLPYTAPIVYLKRFPKISYVKTDMFSPLYNIEAIGALVNAGVFVLGAVSIMICT